MVIVKYLVRSVKSGYTSARLFHDLIAIVLRIEYRGIRLDAIPTFASGRILDKIYPTSSLREFLMGVPGPFRISDLLVTAESNEHVALIVEVVENDGLSMFLQDFR